VEEKIKSPFELGLSAVKIYLEQDNFFYASDSIILLLRGFDDIDHIFHFFSNLADNLSSDKFKSFIICLYERLVYMRSIASEDGDTEIYGKFKDFETELGNYLNSKAGYFRNNNDETTSQFCLDISSKISSNSNLVSENRSKYDTFHYYNIESDKSFTPFLFFNVLVQNGMERLEAALRATLPLVCKDTLVPATRSASELKEIDLSSLLPNRQFSYKYGDPLPEFSILTPTHIKYRSVLMVRSQRNDVVVLTDNVQLKPAQRYQDEEFLFSPEISEDDVGDCYYGNSRLYCSSNFQARFRNL